MENYMHADVQGFGNKTKNGDQRNEYNFLARSCTCVLLMLEHFLLTFERS